MKREKEIIEKIRDKITETTSQTPIYECGKNDGLYTAINVLLESNPPTTTVKEEVNKTSHLISNSLEAWKGMDRYHFDIIFRDVVDTFETYFTLVESSPKQEESFISEEEMIKLIEKFKEEKLPDRNSAFHYEAEISSGLDSFKEWLLSKITPKTD